MPGNWRKRLGVINWKRIIIGVAIIVIIVAPISLLCINWTNLSVLYASGSSSVFPLMKLLSQTYQKHKNGLKPIDVMVESTGSGTGLEKILTNKTSFGNLSYSPDKNIVETYVNEWSSAKIKTITLGIDGIALVYKANVDLNINQDNIDDIYLTFSGVESKTFKDLGANGKDENLRLIPFARTGGRTKSGTTEAFVKNSGFKLDKNNEKLNQALENIDTGAYGPNLVETTKESQAESWNQVLSYNKNGSIVYLSTGFVLQNYQTIVDNGYKVATYNGKSLSKENIQNGNYNWTRMLNTLVRLENLNDNIKIWIDWLFTNYSKNYVQNAYNNIGIIQLDQSQIDSMKKGNDFWVDDLTIQPIDSAPENYKYGAQK